MLRVKTESQQELLCSCQTLAAASYLLWITIFSDTSLQQIVCSTSLFVCGSNYHLHKQKLHFNPLYYVNSAGSQEMSDFLWTIMDGEQPTQQDLFKCRTRLQFPAVSAPSVIICNIEQLQWCNVIHNFNIIQLIVLFFTGCHSNYNLLDL